MSFDPESHPDPTQAAETAVDRPAISVRVEEVLAAASMAIVCLITFVNVVVRYLTDASFAFTEEVSVFLLVVLTLVGASAAFARNRNIRVTFFSDRLPRDGRRALEVLILLLAVVLFAFVTWTGARLTLDDWRWDTTSPGIGVPQWWYSVWLPILALAIVLRLLGRLVREVRSWRSA